MRVGFTGTQKGLTKYQKEKLEHWIRQNRFRITEFHHGDCIGADAEAHNIMTHIAGGAVIHIHQPDKSVKRAWCQWFNAVVYEAKPYLERNHDIVDNCDWLLVAPETPQEKIRSGTWSTYRYAVKQQDKHLPITLFLPNGDVKEHGQVVE